MFLSGCFRNGNYIELDLRDSSGALPKAEFEVVMLNESSGALTMNPHNWVFSKKVNGRYVQILPGVQPQPIKELDSGESHKWKVTIDNTNLGWVGEEISASPKNINITGLGPGTYKFSTQATIQELLGKNQVSEEIQIKIDGDPIELSKTDSISSVQKNGDVVEVSLTTESASRESTVVVEHGSGGGQRLILEQVMQSEILRNSIPFLLQDVDKVEIKAPPSVTSATAILLNMGYGISGYPFRISYEDNNYRIIRPDNQENQS